MTMPESTETVTEATEAEDTTSTTDETEPAEDTEPETFAREYVEQLRGENAKYRQRAKDADTLAERLHTELVRATGRLADPTDLPFDPDHLDDPDALAAAVDELLAAKPHLATRRPSGDIGQGQRGQAAGSFSLLQMLKDRT